MDKKYLVTMTKEFCIKAENEDIAQEKAIDMCADDPETLMPHNMDVQVIVSALPDSYFEN